MTVWVRLRSWHILRDDDLVTTLCGRRTDVNLERAGTLPMGDRSCEACLRLNAHILATTAAPEDPNA